MKILSFNMLFSMHFVVQSLYHQAEEHNVACLQCKNIRWSIHIPLGTLIINPRRACAARVTVLGLSVCLSVCLSVTR